MANIKNREDNSTPTLSTKFGTERSCDTFHREALILRDSKFRKFLPLVAIGRSDDVSRSFTGILRTITSLNDMGNIVIQKINAADNAKEIP